MDDTADTTNTTVTQIVTTPLQQLIPENINDCIGCAGKITGTVKINLPCRHEYCDKCVDKIIVKSSTSRNGAGELKCFVCEPDEEGGDIETGNNCTKCYKKYCCTEFCDKYYGSCGSFLKILCCTGTCFNEEFVRLTFFAFVSLLTLLTIASIPLGITMLTKYGDSYNDAVSNFIIASVVCNGFYFIFMVRFVSVINEMEDEGRPASCIFIGLFLIMHILLLSIGSYNLSQHFDHNETVIVFVTINCLNICLLGLMIAMATGSNN